MAFRVVHTLFPVARDRILHLGLPSAAFTAPFQLQRIMVALYQGIKAHIAVESVGMKCKSSTYSAANSAF